MSYVINVKTLREKQVNKSEDLVIIDVRYYLNDTKAGRNAYHSSHLPQAYFLDIAEDLSGKAEKHGGDHPLPDVNKLAKKLGEMGVSQSTTVVVYGETNDMFAARAWWLLHYLGHEHVYILDGGLQRWLEADYPVTRERPEQKTAVFNPKVNSDLVADINHVKENVSQPQTYLLDSRAEERYLGKTEPLYKKAGHIPGAKNYFWANVLNDDGLWKRKEELEENFADLPKESEIIVSCGSGISACPNVLALNMIGYENVKLYPGSFSDWISYDRNPVETKKE